MEHYKEVNEELERKLVIKRRKENKDISDRIYSSFAEKLPKNNAFASFGGGQVQGDMPYEKMNFKKGEKLANVIEGD